MRTVLTHLSGSDEGRRDIFPMGKIVLGRDSECDVAFDLTKDLEVSGRHAEISCVGKGQICIVDLGSTNGTWVNGTEIQEQTPLRSGDEIELGPGGPRLRVELRSGLWVLLLGLLFSRRKSPA